jgi:hypothetical protein
MNTEQFVALLQGRQYRDEITEELEETAKENGLLVLFGASDDLLELRGAVSDEVGAYKGGIVYLVKKKGNKLGVVSEHVLDEIQALMSENDLEYSLPKIKAAASEWCPPSLACSWLITTDFPHSTFDIMEDNDLYCRGVVIDIRDIENALNNLNNNQNK